jgi:Transposase
MRAFWRTKEMIIFFASMAYHVSEHASHMVSRGSIAALMPYEKRATLPQSLSQNALKPARNCVGSDNRLSQKQQEQLQILQEADDELSQIYDLAQTFFRLIRDHSSSQLTPWMERALQGKIPELRSFVRGLERDEAAVRAGLDLPWSQGQTEGQITRLKLIKRQGYGRAKFDLLRQRVLHAAWSFLTVKKSCFLFVGKENHEMIVRCDHLRLIGILKYACCPNCHGPAGCVGEQLPAGHQVIYCCARTSPLTVEERALVLAHIPKWEARMATPKYARLLGGILMEYQEKLKDAQAQGQQRKIRQLQCTIKRFEQLLTNVGAPFDGSAYPHW